MFETIRKELGKIFHELSKQKECKIIEGHLRPNHVHMCIEIPPKYAVSTVGFEIATVKQYIHEQEEADKYGRF